MAPENAVYPGVPGSETALSQMSNILKDFNPTVSDIVSRSIITSSFNTKDRFDWLPHVGLRVSIPDRFSFMPFERAPAAELRNRLFPFPNVRGHRHKSATQPAPLPDRSLAWWFAQLVHYGLPITCDRDQAKESIKLAIMSDRLFVPLRIQELESELKRQYVTVPIHRPGMTMPDHLISTSMNHAASRELGCASQQAQDQTQPIKHIKKQSERVEQHHVPTIETLKLADQFSLGETSDSSKGDSSGKDDDNCTHETKSGHLFTPRGNQIVHPIVYPGLLEREETEKLKKQQALKKQNTEELRTELENEKRSKKTKLQRPQTAQTLSRHNAGSSLLSETSANIVPETRDRTNSGKSTKITSALHSKSKERGKALTSANPSVTNCESDIWEMSDSDDHIIDGDTTSQVLMPLSPQCRRKCVDKVGADSDERSVILSGWKIVAQGTGASNTDTSKDMAAKSIKSSAELTENKVRDQAKKVCVNKAKDASRSAKHEKRNSKKEKAKAKKGKPKLTKPPSVIEISSDSGDSSHGDDLDDSVAEIEILLPQQVVSSSAPTKRSRKPLKVKGSTRPASSPIRQVSKANSKSQRSVEFDPSEVPSTPRATTVKSMNKVSVDITRDSLNKPPAGIQDFDVQNQNSGTSTGRKNGHNNHLHCTPRSTNEKGVLIDAKFKVPDLTDCGITEMSGGLGPGDDKAITESLLQRALAFRGFSPVTLREQNKPAIFLRPQSVPRTPSVVSDLKNSTTFAQSDSVFGSPDANDSDDSIPSLTDLFASQETPEPWRRLLKKNADARKKIAIKESYNPDSVPAMREALSSVPSYLKTFVRHDSPELFCTPVRNLSTVLTDEKTEEKVHRERSRSVSVTAVSRKRSRPNLIEIEGGAGASALKRQRVSASRYEPANTAIGVMRVNQTIHPPGSTPAPAKPMETIAAKHGLLNSASRVGLKRDAPNVDEKRKRCSKVARKGGEKHRM